jgi:hypothetical protein
VLRKVALLLGGIRDVGQGIAAANHAQQSIEKHNEAMIEHQNDVLAAKELEATEASG